jgi:4-amino-4-deoxy-L-arabinose transferase-like glycosyltransferase
VSIVRGGGSTRGWGAWAASHPVILLLPLLAFLVLVSVAFPDRQDDEAGYLELARNLTHGHYATGRPDALLDADPAYPDLWFGPGLPLALAGPVAAGVPLDLLRLSGPLFLFLALVLFFLLTRRSMSTTAALAATWALGLYLPFYTVLPNLHSEPLAVLFVVLALYATSRLLEEGGRGWLVLGAVALAGVALTRVAYGWVLTLLLVVGLVWWAVSRRRDARSLAAMVALALVFCLPWLAYTTSETGRVLQWGNSGALSLYWMSSPYPGDVGDWQQANDVFTDPALAPHRPFFESLRGLSLPEQNERLARQALENIGDHPLRYLRNVGANISRMFFDLPYSHVPERWNALGFALPNTILLLCLAFSAVLAIRVRAELPPPTVPFAVFALAAFGVHALVAAYPRMLIPIVPVLAWLVTTTIATYVRAQRHALTSVHGTADERGMPQTRDGSPRARALQLRLRTAGSSS